MFSVLHNNIFLYITKMLTKKQKHFFSAEKRQAKSIFQKKTIYSTVYTKFFVSNFSLVLRRKLWCGFTKGK